MPSFSQLSILQRAIRILKVSAGVLAVAVEKQSVKRSIQIVMVSYVVLGPTDRIVLMEASA